MKGVFEQDGEEFDFMKWIDEEGLDGINIAKLHKVKLPKLSYVP